MKREYTIRPARPADLDRLVDLMQALQEHLEAANPDLWRKDDAQANLKGQLSARLTATNGCVLVAEHEEDGVVGAIFGRIVKNKRYIPSRAGMIDQAYVQEAHRRAGIASQLVVELCRFFAEQGVDDLSLRYVVGNEEAAAFWTNLGFAPRILTTGTTRTEVETRLAQDRKT
jgi:ribosomal protein S18 acetylase RimI-like enzyme